MHVPYRSISLLLGVLLSGSVVAGCLGGDDDTDVGPVGEDGTVDYSPMEPDPGLGLVESQHLFETRDSGVEIHVRVVRPDVDGPVGVITEFTPYQALAPRNPMLEPVVGRPDGTFVQEFVQRGFAFAYADVRGTGDSGGCMDLRGSVDIQDAGELTRWLGTRDWSNGKVGFIGASYPGSMAHIAGIANDEHLGGIVPVVASTSFYDYHHKGGVPYSNHLTTNNAYNAIAATPTVNPHHGNYVPKYTQQPGCDQDHLVVQTDQSGAYTDWWHDRNLRWRAEEVEVPVLMVQGLQDWNVKPDHIAHYFNDLDSPKTLIAPQMGHRYADIGDPEEDEEDGPFGWWWEFAASFFDETLNGVHTGLFDEDRAYVQYSDEDWHIHEGSWPPEDASHKVLNLTDAGLRWDAEPSGSVSWEANPASDVLQEDPTGTLETQEAFQVVLESKGLETDLTTSGTPRLNMTLTSSAETVHIVAVLEYLGPGAEDWERVNHAYLNPVYRKGIDDPQPVTPGAPMAVSLAFYPQADVFEAGGKLRLVLASTDESRSVPAFDPGTIEVDLGNAEHPGTLSLPLSPSAHD